MGKRTENEKQKVIKYSSNNLSQEQMVEIQAEAYYRALKRIDNEKLNEKTNDEEISEEKRKNTWYENLLFILNVYIWPWKIHKRFHLNNNIYDNVLVTFISLIMKLLGCCLWLFGIAIIPIYIFVIHKSINGILEAISIGIISSMFGSMFILAGDQFAKETDSNKIYAYSSCILALVGCIIAVVAIIFN